MSHTRHTLGKDVQDSRDYTYLLKGSELRRPLPRHVDLRSKCPPVFNQGASHTCTAQAVAAALAYEHKAHGMRSINPSRLFIYYNERDLTGQRSLEPVLRLRNALKAVAKRGACDEKLWPFLDDKKQVGKKPPREAFVAASAHRIFEYQRIPMHALKPAAFLRHLKRCLADGSPILFGIKIYASFESDPALKSGVMPVPDIKHEAFIGGHAVMAVGYDDRRKAVLVRNSWGPKWGDKGYFWMPYKLITNPDLAHDFWTLRGIIVTRPGAIAASRQA